MALEPDHELEASALGAWGVALVEHLVAHADVPRWLGRTRPVLSGGAGPVLARGPLAADAVDPLRIGGLGVIELDPPPMPRRIGEVEVVRLLLVAHGGGLSAPPVLWRCLATGVPPGAFRPTQPPASAGAKLRSTRVLVIDELLVAGGSSPG